MANTKAFYVLLVLSLVMSVVCGRLVPPGPSPITGQCTKEKGVRGPRGPKGEKGLENEAGATGYPGEETVVYVDHDEKCDCRRIDGEAGQVGDPGANGPVGDRGIPGEMGLPGPKGYPGPAGPPGTPHDPASKYHPSDDNMMYVALNNMQKLPTTMCHHFKRQAYVPGIPNRWLGWHETGKSSFLVYDSWLYFTSYFNCPCSIPDPTDVPTPPATS